MKTICVVAAIILREGADAGRQVLSTQRGYGDWKGWWEFPGGKVEPGELPEAALEREIREELSWAGSRSCLSTRARHGFRRKACGRSNGSRRT